MITHEQAAVAVRVTEFWGNVHRAGPLDCWLWTGYVEDGYGRFYFDGRMVGAHELALSFTTGEVRAERLDTCHRCNNPLCCNPAHLRFDTRRSNVADMDTAGRRRQGPTKLTPEQVAIIRARLDLGAKQQDLADQYGVSNSMISMIKTGRRYSNGR